MTVLYVHELCVAAGEDLVLDHVSFHLDAGETLALVGAAGAGKTALCQALAGTLPEALQITGGKIFFANRDLVELDVAARAAVRQSGLTPLRDSGAESLERARESGAEILLLDLNAARGEPSGGWQGLVEARAQTGAAMIVAARDPGGLAALCDAYAVLCAGRLVERAPRAALLESSRHPYSRALLAGAFDRVAPATPGCPYRAACAEAEEPCAGADMRLQLVDPDHATACLRWRDL